MNNFVTVKTFTYAIDVAVIRSRLESEGIECFTQDEIMAQANPFLSNAIGGIKLQVRQSDLQRAIEIMEEGGYLKESDFRPTPLYTAIDNATFRLPWMKGLPMEFRLMVIAAVIACLAMLLLLFSFR